MNFTKTHKNVSIKRHLLLPLIVFYFQNLENSIKIIIVFITIIFRVKLDYVIYINLLKDVSQK